jgi:hypothetical protein
MLKRLDMRLFADARALRPSSARLEGQRVISAILHLPCLAKLPPMRCALVNSIAAFEVIESCRPNNFMAAYEEKQSVALGIS